MTPPALSPPVIELKEGNKSNWAVEEDQENILFKYMLHVGFLPFVLSSFFTLTGTTVGRSKSHKLELSAFSASSHLLSALAKKRSCFQGDRHRVPLVI